jgi:hypothetical protein
MLAGMWPLFIVASLLPWCLQTQDPSAEFDSDRSGLSTNPAPITLGKGNLHRFLPSRR